MSSTAQRTPDPVPVAPPAEPSAIRASLTPMLAAEFDREWDFVLDEAKRAQDLTGVHELLNKWRHTAYMEMREPGAYYRLLAKAEQVMRTGQAPEGSVSGEEMKERINRRLGRQA